jgi:hypothetical protein
MRASVGKDRIQIRLIEGNEKCRHLKKLTCKGTLQQVLVCLTPPFAFCLGWSATLQVQSLVRYRV